MAYPTQLVSVTQSGTAGNNYSGLDGTVSNPSSGTVSGVDRSAGIGQSSNGRYIVFVSEATSFGGIDTNNARDIFLKDMTTGALTRVNYGTNNVDSSHPTVSDNGQYVTFQTGSSIYRVDMNDPGSPQLITSNGSNPHMSANGKFIVYTSNDNQIYLRDMSDVAGTPILISEDIHGNTGNENSDNAFVSNDGLVVFESDADNFVDGSGNSLNANPNEEVFLKNYVTGELFKVSETADGNGGSGSATVYPTSKNAMISGNGRYVVFESTNNDLALISNNNGTDAINSAIYRKDLFTGQVDLVSVGKTGTAAVGATEPSISADGRFVLFNTGYGALGAQDGSLISSNIYNQGTLSPDFNSYWYLKDMSTGDVYNIDLPRSASKMIPQAPTYYQPPYLSYNAILSADAKYITLSSTQTLNTGTYPTNGLAGSADNNDDQYDVFRISLPASITNKVAPATGLTLTGDEGGIETNDLLNGGALGDIILGKLGNDTLNGNAGNDTLLGGDGDDSLNGGLGNDSLNGGLGNDILDGGAGADTMDGGDGDDTYYVDNANDVIIDSDGNDTVVVKLASGTYALAPDSSIENVTLFGTAALSAKGNDISNRIEGNSGANKLEGLAGADTLIGGAGNDTLDGGTGDDSLIGGIGNDLYIVDNAADIIVEQANAGIDTVKIDAGFTLDGETDEPDYILGDNIEHIDASSFTTVGGTGIYLEGNSLANNLTGGNGNDTLDGLDGVDTLKGGLGNDTYHVDLKITNAGKSTATVSLQDTLTELANQGEDTIHLYFDGASYLGTAPAKASTIILAANFEHLDASEAEALLNLTGNTVANHITGNDGNNIILGLAGNDTLEGLDGDDSLDGGDGNDSLDGGDGNDTLTGGKGGDILAGGTGNDTYIVNLTKISNDEAGIEDTVTEEIAEGTDTIKLVGSQVFTSNVTLNMTASIFENIENLDISGTASTKLNITGNNADNYLTGNAAANALEGGDGNDTLEGGAGNDALTGGNDNDKLFGGAGLDTLTGNDGNDFIDGGADNDSISGGSGTDMLFGGLGNDTIDGGDDADFIDGEAGNDSLNGGDGSDTIYGGAGNDFIDGGNGFNQLEGEDGNDTIIGGNNGNSIEGDAGNDSLTGGTDNDLIEGGLGNDILNGLAGNDNLQGGDGNDKLDGGNDDDYLNGGNGIDTLIGGAGADTFSFDSPVIAANADIINDFSGSGENEDGDKIQLDAYFFSAFLNSAEVDSANIVNGTKALDTNDFLIYDAATGKLYYDADGSGKGKAQVLVATLNNKPGTLTAEDFVLIGNSLYSDALVQGTVGADTWNANNQDPEPAPGYAYNGLAGNDKITGHLTINGSLSGGLGNDSITAGNQGDFLYGNEGNDTLQGGSSQDYLAGGDGNDSLFGQDDDDKLFGDAGNDKLDGGSGDDELEGGDGNDTLIGGDGDDTLTGGNGKDVLTGGAGDDVFIFDSALVAANASTITDFTSGEDTLQLHGHVFRKLFDGISEENLAFGTKAVTAEQFLIYDKNTGSLYYDADGSGSGAAIKFATLSGKPDLTVDDFQIIGSGFLL